jgi:hypothetical protein
MLDLYGRSSYDGIGGPLHAAIHGPIPDNAYWDGAEVVLGDGDGTTLGSFARAPDVVYEELTEALIEHTSALVQTGEAGAVRIGIQDAFAAVGDAYDALYNGGDQDPWLIGESVFLPPGGFVRNLADPKSDGISIDNYYLYSVQTDPHYAAGVIDNAFYLLAVGGTNGTSGIHIDGGIGIFAAGQLWFDAAVHHATPSTNMVGWYNAVLAAAKARYGTVSAEVAKVHDVFVAVGVPVPPVIPLLQLDQPIQGLFDDDARDYVIHVPAGTTAVTVRTSGDQFATGDVDLYVRRGDLATPSAFDAASEGASFAERVTVDGAEGDLYVHLEPYSSYGEVTLRATATDVDPSAAVPLAFGQTQTNVSGAAGSWRYYRLDVPQGATDLEVDTGGGNGNASLYLMRGRPPTLSAYGDRSQANGNSEAVSADRPTATTWYVGVYGSSGYSGLHITAIMSPAPTLQPNTTLNGLKGQPGSERSWAVPVPAGQSLDLLLHPGGQATGNPGMLVKDGKLPVIGSITYGGITLEAQTVARVVYVTVVPTGGAAYSHWKLTATTAP